MNASTNTTTKDMNIICLDLEGVLIPEIWISFARETGIDELKLTTRDISDYDVLMKKRIAILDKNNLKLKDIQNVIGKMSPLDGAKEFLTKLREKTQIIILSDTFTQFAKPMMEQLGWPTLFCNTLIIDQYDRIVDYKLRQEDGKKHAVKALQSIGYRIIASGDSYNDINMLKTAESGILFKAPYSILKEFPQFPGVNEYDELFSIIEKKLF